MFDIKDEFNWEMLKLKYRMDIGLHSYYEPEELYRRYSECNEDEAKFWLKELEKCYKNKKNQMLIKNEVENENYEKSYMLKYIAEKMNIRKYNINTVTDVDNDGDYNTQYLINDSNYMNIGFRMMYKVKKKEYLYKIYYLSVYLYNSKEKIFSSMVDLSNLLGVDEVFNYEKFMKNKLNIVKKIMLKYKKYCEENRDKEGDKERGIKKLWCEEYDKKVDLYGYLEEINGETGFETVFDEKMKKVFGIDGKGKFSYYLVYMNNGNNVLFRINKNFNRRSAIKEVEKYEYMNARRKN